MFTCEICEILGTPTLKNICERLLLPLLEVTFFERGHSMLHHATLSLVSLKILYLIAGLHLT